MNKIQRFIEFLIVGLGFICLVVAFYVLVTTNASAQNCTLEWGSVSGADDYDIYYGATSASADYVGTTANTLRTCSQLGITPTVGYVFCIQASNDGGNSSNVCSTWRKRFVILDYDCE